MESNTVRINIVFYAESESEVRTLAGKILESKQSEDVFSHCFDGVPVHGYIRFPGCVASASPSGITDVLIVQVNSAESEHWTAVKNYVDTRRGIPYKFLTSSVDLSAQAKTHELDFISIADLTADAKEKVLRPALNLEQALRQTFDKIDSDHDGYLEVNEILSASVALGHPLNDEEAKEIVKSLSSDGKVCFDKFKQWWVMGRSDFNSFRKIVQVEMVVHSLIKQSSDVFNSYLDKMQKDGASANSANSYQGRVNIVTSDDFDAGVGLSLHITAGTDFQAINNTLPSHLREHPVSFGLELKIKSEEHGKPVIETLTGLKEMLVGMAGLGEVLSGGIDVQFRHVGTSVFVDVSYGGAYGDKLQGLLSIINLSALNFSGSADLHLTNKVFLPDLLGEKLFTDIMKDAFHVKFEQQSEFVQLKNLFGFLVDTFSMMAPHLGNQAKIVGPVLKVLAASRKLGFNFTYDASMIFEVLKDYVVAESNEEQFWSINEAWPAKGQPSLKGPIDQAFAVAPMFLGPFLEAIKQIDFDNISFFATCPSLTAYAKFSLMIRGLTNFVLERLG